jgi:hypothetical protein
VPTAIVAALMTAAFAWACAAGRPPAPHAPPPPIPQPVSDHARDALVPTCGSCHRSDLPTAKPGALAVFDLTKDPWWVTPEPDHLDGLLRRVKGSSDIPDDDKAAVETFVAAIRQPSPPTPEP